MSASLTTVILEERFAGYDEERQVLRGLSDVEVCQPADEDELVAAVRAADGILVNLYHVSARAIAAMQHCKVISIYGIGYDHVDVAAATDAGIWVCHVPDYGWEDVSDHALAMFLSCARKLNFADAAVRSGQWGTPRNKPSFRIKGKVFGLLGFGGTGRALFGKLAGLGLARILVSDPMVAPEEIEALGAVPCDLPTLLRESDFVSVHVPLNEHTHHLIGADELQSMKSTAILVNTSRGAVLDEAAVAAALAADTIAYAGLDVFEREPLPADSPLMTLDNVILSDHGAYYTEESVVELKTKAARNVREVYAGRPPVYPLNHPSSQG